MRILRNLLILLAATMLMSSCGAPIVNNTLSLPGRAVRSAAHTVGLGGVGGL